MPAVTRSASRAALRATDTPPTQLTAASIEAARAQPSSPFPSSASGHVAYAPEMGRGGEVIKHRSGLTDVPLLELDDSMFGGIDGDDILDTPEERRTGLHSTDTSTFNVAVSRGRSQASRIAGRDEGPVRPRSQGPITPGTNSTINLGSFKRRPRERSILVTARRHRSRSRQSMASEGPGKTVMASEDSGKTVMASEDSGKTVNTTMLSHEARISALEKQLEKAQRRVEEVAIEVRAQLVEKMEVMMVAARQDKKEAIERAIQTDRAQWEGKLEQAFQLGRACSVGKIQEQQRQEEEPTEDPPYALGTERTDDR